MTSSPTETHTPKQRFTGYWIPVELSKLGLNATEQFLLSMIDSLEGDEPDYCFASNAYFAEKLDLSESRISFYITKFKRMGLIEEVGYDGRRRRIRALKENWYKNKPQDSRKTLCVKTSSQTACFQEVRLRENANHIEKIDKEEDNKASSSIVSSSNSPKIDDDDSKKSFSEESKEIQVTRTNGQKISMTQSDVYRYFVKKPQYTTEMIKRAIDKIRTVTGPVNDILKYLESICEGELRQTKAAMGEDNKIKYEYKQPEPEKPRVKMGDLIRRELEKNKDKNE